MECRLHQVNLREVTEKALFATIVCFFMKTNLPPRMIDGGEESESQFDLAFRRIT